MTFNTTIILFRQALASEGLRAMLSRPHSKLLNIQTNGSGLCLQLETGSLRMESHGSRIITSHSPHQPSKDHIRRWARAMSLSCRRLLRFLTHSPTLLQCLTFRILHRVKMKIFLCTHSTIHRRAVSFRPRLLVLHQQGMPGTQIPSRMVLICCYTWPTRHLDRQVLGIFMPHNRNNHQHRHRNTLTSLPQ